MTAPGQPTGSYDQPRPGALGGPSVPAPTAPGGPVGPTQPDAPRQRPAARRRRGGVSWVVYAVTVLILVIAILVVLFVAKNSQHVSIWLFGTRKYMSVAGALSLAAGAGLVVGLLIGVITQVPVRRKLRAAKRRLEG